MPHTATFLARLNLPVLGGLSRHLRSQRRQTRWSLGGARSQLTAGRALV